MCERCAQWAKWARVTPGHSGTVREIDSQDGTGLIRQFITGNGHVYIEWNTGQIICVGIQGTGFYYHYGEQNNIVYIL